MLAYKGKVIHANGIRFKDTIKLYKSLSKEYLLAAARKSNKWQRKKDLAIVSGLEGTGRAS